MKLNSIGKALGTTVSATAIAALTLTACGSDNNASAPSTSASGTGTGTASASADCGGKNALTAEGSTAQQNAIAEFNKVWGQVCSGKNLSYNPTGSGAGRQQFIAKQVDFAGSDSALGKDQVDPAAQRCGGNPAWNLPLVFGPVAMAYNLEGVDKLVLNADVIAKIFQGQITKWNDPAIAALNSGATLPSTAIQAVHRSDESGTTDNFTKYLSKTAKSDWTYDHAKAWKAPGGTGAAKSDGVAALVKSTAGTIAYVELSFAENSSLSMAKVKNGAGEFTELTGDSAGKTIEGAKVVGTGNDLKMDIDYATTTPGAYPIVLVTYEIACSKGSAKAADIKAFLTYTSSSAGQSVLSDLGYAPLPSSVQSKVATAVASIS